MEQMACAEIGIKNLKSQTLSPTFFNTQNWGKAIAFGPFIVRKTLTNIE